MIETNSFKERRKQIDRRYNARRDFDRIKTQRDLLRMAAVIYRATANGKQVTEAELYWAGEVMRQYSDNPPATDDGQ